MKYDNQLRYASDIVRRYDGSIPLSAWLKDFFRVNKQMGSTDRKVVSEMVYGYYRLGYNEFPSVEERILAFTKFSGNLPAIREYFFPAGNDSSKQISSSFSVEKIFPFTQHLSPGIDQKSFCESFLVQPDLFIRIRPGHERSVLEKLDNNKIPYRRCGDFCIAVPNATNIENVLSINSEAVVQDKSSQETAELLQIYKNRSPGQVHLWDCCAASGGKSLMAHDVLDNVVITASDVRTSIIANLEKRFHEAGIGNYTSFVADLIDESTKIPAAKYDLVIADVPCTGSGTWSRTPEQLYFFNIEKADHYSRLQKKIVSRVIPSLNANGALLYITCSVFAKENEEVVDFIIQNHKLKLVKSMLIAGYHQKADTLFAALLTNSSA